MGDYRVQRQAFKAASDHRPVVQLTLQGPAGEDFNDHFAEQEQTLRGYTLTGQAVADCESLSMATSSWLIRQAFGLTPQNSNDEGLDGAVIADAAALPEALRESGQSHIVITVQQ